MKVHAGKVNTFQPVTLTLETLDELRAMVTIFEDNSSVTKALNNDQRVHALLNFTTYMVLDDILIEREQAARE